MPNQTIDMNNVTSVTFNNSSVNEIYLNNSLIWPLSSSISTDPFITFSSSNSFTLQCSNTTSQTWSGTIDYSTDKTNWTTWNVANSYTLYSASDGTKHNLYLRGICTNVGGSSSAKRFIIKGSNISISGNMENLIDYTAVLQGNHPVLTNSCFRFLFYGNADITDISNLTMGFIQCLDAKYVCASMFQNCTGLTSLPATLLPATTICDYCYSAMFKGCTGITSIPSGFLPATTIGQYVYNDMFSGCTGITSIPTNLLPSTTGAYACYRQMFLDCSNLVNCPSLPATDLGGNSTYQNMFKNCVKLETIPALPATVFKQACYQGMFYNCTKIKISDTQTSEYLNPYRIPVSGTAASVASWNTDMFYATGGTWTANPSRNTNYYTSNTIV